jgi:CBS domain-containing protein
MRIAEVLHHKGKEVATVRTTETVEAAVRKLAQRRIGAVLVTDRWGKLAGIFSERDVIYALAKHGAAAMAFEIHELMTTPVTTCSPDDRVDEMMAMMSLHRIRHLPVLQDGEIAGIVSIGDLIKDRLIEKEQEANVLLDLSRARL